MLALKMLYESQMGSFRVFAQVFATGKGKTLKNWMHGGGVIPAGGTAVSPVANIIKSSRHTAVAFSERRK